ncbi:hypothetical protein PYCCODRAFT_1470339 [Trametes coccinea BRFM310]|uniref:DUF6534 domain-containing protein n=1 Tax=Trametes coccinea (strain BRFM310) TaxID=1353009 RepID=A0A1Y2IDU3_TRAC3|nr:hypothetical protein PYCCODRAFT_1470339 [Trametes coccinea BRFM310]
MSLRDAETGLDGLPASVVSTSKFFLRCLIVGCTLSAILYGITLQQAFLYYRRYARDNLPLKLFVAVLVILDTVATIFMIHGLDTYVVVDYLQPEKMTGLVWSLTVRPESPLYDISSTRTDGVLKAENCLCIITSVMVQWYVHPSRCCVPSVTYSSTSYSASAFGFIFTGLLFALAFVELVSGIWLTVNMGLNPGFSAFSTQRPRILTLVYSGCSSVCDVFITAGLCYFLHTGKSGVKSSNSLIDKLMIYAVQRGIITLICQAYDFLTASRVILE